MQMYTPRDILIMRLIFDDWTYTEIASELGISPWTVRARVSLLCRRLNTHDRKEAAELVLSSDPSLARALKPIPTDRQLSCLKLAMAGLSNKEIGQELKIAPQTVKIHLSELYEMIGANDRCHALALAISGGWIEPTEIQTYVRSYYDQGRTRRKK